LEIIPEGQLLFIPTLILDTIVTRQLWHPKKKKQIILPNFSIKIELYVEFFLNFNQKCDLFNKAAGFEPAPY